MPVFIPRPDPIAQFFANAATQESIKQQREHDEDVAARKRKQKLTALGIGAGFGAIGGIALAPTLELGGSAVAGSTIPGLEASLAATTLTPTGALLGGLGGAAIGSRFAGQLADEDIAGALGTAATTTAGIVHNLEDQKVYGYTPTKEERSALAQAAVKAGTTLGALTTDAKRSGVPVGKLLAGATAAAEGRQAAQAGEIEFQQTAAHLLANQQAAIRSNLYDFVPDEAKLAQVQVDKQWTIENMRPPSGGGEPAMSMEEGRRMLDEIAQREDFLLSNPVRVPKKQTIATEVGPMKGGDSKRIGHSDWEVNVVQEKSGSLKKTIEKTIPYYMTFPAGSDEYVKEKKVWEEDQIHNVNGKLYKRTKDGVLDEVDQAGGEFKPMSYKEARAIAFKEMPKETYPDTDTERAGLPKPIDLETLHKNSLEIMRRDLETRGTKPPEPQSRTAPANIELDAVANEIEGMIGTYGNYDNMGPEEQQQFDALLQQYQALGGT